MPPGVTIRHKRKAGAFLNGELAAGEQGLDVATGTWWFSRNGTTVETKAAAGDMTAAEYATNGAPGVVDHAVNADELGEVAASQYATKAYADNAASTAVGQVIGAAPAALDTLNEIAAALADDANFASTMTTALAGKAPLSHQHDASDINAGNLATARMQANVAAALQAASTTLNSANLTIDGGTL